MYHKTLAYRMFSCVNYALLSAVSVLCLLPLLHVAAVSMSASAPANAGLVAFWPLDFTMDAYRKSFLNPNFVSSIYVSVIRTVSGTALGLAVTAFAAYGLSKDKALSGRSVYLWYFLFTMLFSGGLIPNYLLITKLGLINSIWSLILPGLVGVYNMILLINFFRTVPKDMEEAAFMDGANHIQTFRSIYVPISVPALATIALFIMVGQWNAYFDGLIYIRDADKLPLASLLQMIVVQADATKVSPETIANLSQRTVKAAQIVIGILPILLVYPLLQRFFVKGIVLGAVKE